MSETASTFSPYDVPTEGKQFKRTQALLSPSESEIESQIASAEPHYVDVLRSGIARLKVSSATRLRAHYSSTGRRGSLATDGLKEREPDYAPGKLTKLLLAKEVDIVMGKSMKEIFAQYVRPLDILGYFHQYDPDVLNQHDLNAVHAITVVEGNMPGALELFDRLQNYEGWLPCLIKTMRDPNVNLNELTDLILLHLGLERATQNILNDPANRERLARLLKATLRMHLKPLEILPLFHVYDPNVLVQDDIDEVENITTEMGDEIGSDELIDRLLTYPGWHPCLISVLKHCGLGYLADILNEEITKEFPEIQLAEKMAQKQFKAQMKEYKKQLKEKQKAEKEGSSITSDWSDETRALRMHPGQRLKQMVQDVNICPKYQGLDWNKKLGPRKMSHLPNEIELADQKLQLLLDRELDDVSQEPGLHERMVNPMMQGEQYLEKYAITELFTFMLTRVVLDKPTCPLDYLIELAGQINRLNTTRKEVDQLSENRKKAEKERTDAEADLSMHGQEAVQQQKSSADSHVSKFRSAEQSRVTFKM